MQASETAMEKGLESGPGFFLFFGGGGATMRGLDASIKLLRTLVQVRPQEEDTNLCSEVGHRVLLIAAGRDLQILVLDHLKFVEVC